MEKLDVAIVGTLKASLDPGGMSCALVKADTRVKLICRWISQKFQ